MSPGKSLMSLYKLDTLCVIPVVGVWILRYSDVPLRMNSLVFPVTRVGDPIPPAVLSSMNMTSYDTCTDGMNSLVQ